MKRITTLRLTNVIKSCASYRSIHYTSSNTLASHVYTNTWPSHIKQTPCNAFSFAILHRSPIHCEAVEQDIFQGQSYQFVLKLAQPNQSNNLIPYTMHEIVFTADMLVGELTNIIRSRLNGIQSVSLTQNGNTISLDKPLESLYTKKNLAFVFVLTSNPSQTYTVMINGGLPFVRGIQGFWSRNKLVLTAATIALISIASMIIEDKPNRSETNGSNQRDQAIAHWNKRDHEEHDSWKAYMNENTDEEKSSGKSP